MVIELSYADAASSIESRLKSRHHGVAVKFAIAAPYPNVDEVRSTFYA